MPTNITSDNHVAWRQVAIAQYETLPMANRNWHRVAMALNERGLRTKTGCKWSSADASQLAHGEYDPHTFAEKAGPRHCEYCGTEYAPGAHNQRCCTPDCANAVVSQRDRTRRKPFCAMSHCQACGALFIPSAHHQKYCSEPCAAELKREQSKYVPKPPSEADRFGDGISDMPFPLLNNESEFVEWVCDNLAFFGLKELVRGDIQTCPDLIAKSTTGEQLRIEIEYYAPNFLRHKHDPDRCDLIIAYIAEPEQPTIKGVPVVSLMVIEQRRDARNVRLSDVRLSDFTQSVMNTAAALIGRRLLVASERVA